MKHILALSLTLLTLPTIYPSVPAPRIGFAEMQGRRKTMEDEHCVITEIVADKKVEYYGVFDGHGGDRAAKLVAKHLHKNIFASEHFPKNIEEACIEGCHLTDEQIISTGMSDGTCVIAALIVDDTIYALNLGDSRAVVCSDGQTIALCDDHKPNRPDEYKRIIEAGGFVAVYGVPRVGGRLAISRALGDAHLKAPALPQSWVSATPEIMTHTRTTKDDFLLLACDGVWDVLSNEQAVKIVKNALDSGNSLDKAAKKLRNAAYQRGSGDNISVMVVPLKN